jgi:hypothetical protein
MGFLIDRDVGGIQRHLGFWVELIPTCVLERYQSLLLGWMGREAHCIVDGDFH